MNTTSPLAALLKSTTYELCRPEGRVVGTPGHATAERYVALSLTEIGCRPYRGTSFALPYRRDGIRVTLTAWSRMRRWGANRGISRVLSAGSAASCRRQFLIE